MTKTTAGPPILKNIGQENGEIDIVFLHGFLGDATKTWTSEDGEFYWPAKLSEDLKETVCTARVWTPNYEAVARMIEQSYDIPLGLKQRAATLCHGVLEGSDRLGDHPIVFIAHSLGGLMVKAMLDREWANETPDNVSAILRQTKAVVFLGTPHSGSGLANMGGTLSSLVGKGIETLGSMLGGLFGVSLLGSLMGTKLTDHIKPSETVKSLEVSNPELADLMQTYRVISQQFSIDTLSCFETKNYLGQAIVVPQSSADPGVGQLFAIEGADHSNICKPKDNAAPVYRMVRHVIARAVTSARRGSKCPVFAEQAEDIFRTIRASHFPMLSRFGWESNKSAPVIGTLLMMLSDIPTKKPKDLQESNATWTENDWTNLRRRVVVEFFYQCEAAIRTGAMKVVEPDEAAAESSQFDLDKLVLIAWRKHRSEEALKSMRRLIEEQCGFVRSTYRPTLTVLYRAIDSLDKVISDQLTLSLGTELRLAREGITARAQKEELDEDGITRGRIDDLIKRIRTMAEASL